MYQSTPHNALIVWDQYQKLSQSSAVTANSSSIQVTYNLTVKNGLVHSSITTRAHGVKSTSKSTKTYSNAKRASIHYTLNASPTTARVRTAGLTKNWETASLSPTLQRSQLPSRRLQEMRLRPRRQKSLQRSRRITPSSCQK